LTFYVKQNYPNPFNPSTNITYGVPKESFVSVKVYNILGQEIATIFEGHQNAGVHTFSFNGAELASGVYLYRVQAGNSVETRRMVLMK
jgi:flagellar hook assembly protein FlgD